MTTAETATTAPDARALIDLLTERLRDNGQDMPEIKESASTLMLIDRFSPELRQDVYNFLQTCIPYDLMYARNLVLKHPAEPNRFATFVHAIEPIRTINRGRAKYDEFSANVDLMGVYKEMWLQEVDGELDTDGLNEVIGVHFAHAIGAGFDFGIRIADYFPENPDLLKFADLVVPALTAFIDSHDSDIHDHSERKVKAVLEVSTYILERPAEASRIAAVIRSHKGFNRVFMDELLAHSRTPIEEGTL